MDKTTLKLVEKITRAKIALEGALSGHGARCPVDADPDYMGPCTCGASERNSPIESALEALDLDDE